VVRELTEAERAHILSSAAGYVERAQEHQASLRGLHIQEG